jgi:LPXTG-site transpeptidase (sortase) family protein
MDKLWRFINRNRDWLFIILGLILIVFAALNLFNADPYSIIANLKITPAVDQEGFAPIFIPKPSREGQLGIPVVESPEIPERIVVDKINLDAPIEIAESMNVNVSGQDVIQYLVPEKFAAGWHEGSASLGVVGNTVISGHHNAYEEVFKDLVDLKVGDTFILLSGKNAFEYVIANKMILPEKNEPLEVRLENGRWILPSKDERVTLVTCWPENTNTHRLIIVAVPVEDGSQLIPETAATQAPLRLATPAAAFLEPEAPTPQPTVSYRLTTPAIKLLNIITPTPASAIPEFIVRNASQFSVNIRELPTIQSGILGSFKAGDEANGLGRVSDGTWIYIEYKGIKGWVDAELVQILTPVESLPTIVAPKTAP